MTLQAHPRRAWSAGDDECSWSSDGELHHDNANRLTQIMQGTATVQFGYDAANRRTSLTLPNGVVTEDAYDAASQLVGLTYKKGATQLGNLTYEYDSAGRRAKGRRKFRSHKSASSHPVGELQRSEPAKHVWQPDADILI